MLIFFRIGLLRAIWQGLGRAKVGYFSLAIGLLFILFGVHIPIFFFCGLIAVFRGRGELKVKHANWVCFGFFLGLMSVFFELMAYSIDPSVDLFSIEPKARYVYMFSFLFSILSIYTFVYNVFRNNFQLALNIGFGIIVAGSVINFLTMSGLFFVINTIFILMIVIVLFITFAIYNKAKMDSGNWYSYGKGDIERDDENKKAEFSKWERGRVNISGFIAAFLALIAIILIFVELYSCGWYYTSAEITEGDYSIEMGNEYGLSEAKYYMKDNEDYEEEEYKYANEKIADEFDIVEILLIISIVFASLFLLAAILAGLRLLPGLIPLIVGIVAVIMIVSGPFYMIFNLPDAFAEDFMEDDYEGDDSSEEDFDGPHKSFWGSDSESEGELVVEISWGPYWCWYLSLAIGGLVFIGSYSCRRIKRYEGGWADDDYRKESVEYDDEDEDDEELDVLERLRRKQRKEREKLAERERRKSEEEVSRTMAGRENSTTGSRKCSKCGVLLIPNDATFCQICGTDQNRPASTIPNSLDMHDKALGELKTKNKCAGCGKLIDPPLIFCLNCVMNFEKDATGDTSPPLSGSSGMRPLDDPMAPTITSTYGGTPLEHPASGRYASARSISDIPITPQRYVQPGSITTEPVSSVTEVQKRPIATTSPMGQGQRTTRSTSVPTSTPPPHIETLPIVSSPLHVETPEQVPHPQKVKELSAPLPSLEKPSQSPTVPQPVTPVLFSQLPSSKLISIDCPQCMKNYMAQVSLIPSMVNCPFCNWEKIINTL